MMNENEPLLKEEKESLFFADEENTPIIGEERSQKEAIINKEETPLFHETESEIVIDSKENETMVMHTKDFVGESVEKKGKKPKFNFDLKANKDIITTVILEVFVLFLFSTTLINFYYGFKYKNYVPEDEISETNTDNQ